VATGGLGRPSPPAAPRGAPQIEVTFDIDANGILNVSAKDKATGKTQNIKITGSVGLTDEEVKKAQEDAEKNKAEDEKKAEQIKTKNNADAMITTAEKSIKDAGEKAPKEAVEKVQEKIKNLKDILETGTKEDLEAKTKELSETLSEVGQAMYANQTPPAGDAAQPGAEEPKEEEKKDKKGDGKVEEGEVVE